MNADSRPSVSSRQTEQVSTHMFLESKLPNKTSMKVHILVAATNCDNQNVSKWLHRAETGVGERANRDRLANPDGHERWKEKYRAAGHFYTFKAQVAVELQKVAEMSGAEFNQHYKDGQTPNEIVGLCVSRSDTVVALRERVLQLEEIHMRAWTTKMRTARTMMMRMMRMMMMMMMMSRTILVRRLDYWHKENSDTTMI